ncbi:hypothetical protein [Streptomyces sp. NPDC046862]|uniref:hypothetical protein n=1 Tax=Streptomyces sp. NPDC046862 TaxID=3154603 RepID=UPI003455861C
MTGQLVQAWTDIAPKDAKDLDLTRDLHISAPLNENGERCPWPWEPQQLVGAPIGQFHCSYCGAMVMAGIPHPDYAPDDRVLTPENLTSVYEWCDPSKLRHENVNGRLECVGLTVIIGDQRVPARFGDTIRKDEDGMFIVIPASEGTTT